MKDAVQQALNVARQSRRRARPAPPTQEGDSMPRLYRVGIIGHGKPGQRKARWYAVAADSEETAAARAIWGAGMTLEQASEVKVELLDDGVLLVGTFTV